MTKGTMKLVFPAWQGCGPDNRVFHSTLNLGEKLFGYDLGYACDKVAIPSEETLEIEAGIFGRSSILKGLQNARLLIDDRAPQRIFMVGGTCGTELATVSYLNSLYGGELGIVWFDAHGDLNTPATSPSAHFHGMVLRTLLGEGDLDLVREVKLPLSPAQVFIAGVRDLDSQEREFIEQSRIKTISPMELEEKAALPVAIKAAGFTKLYIHLDLDVLDQHDFPDVLVPTPGGLSLGVLGKSISTLIEHFDVVGFSVVEFCQRNDSQESLDLIAEFLNDCNVITHWLLNGTSDKLNADLKCQAP